MSMVNKPKHYIGINGLEVEEVLQNFIPKYEDSYTGHRVSSAIEYLLRSPQKNGLEDIKKAKQNLEQIIAYEEKENEKFDDKWVVETELINKRLAQKQAIDRFMGGAPE